MSDTLLDEKAEGERLRLAAGGAWIAKNARLLEAQIDGAARRNGGVKRVDIDMAGIERLDTFGAWLLERLVRSFSARGCETKVTGLKEDYRALMDEVHNVKTDKIPSSAWQRTDLYALSSVGVTMVAVGHARLDRQHAGRAGGRAAARGGASAQLSVSPRWCISSTMSAGARCRSSC